VQRPVAADLEMHMNMTPEGNSSLGRCGISRHIFKKFDSPVSRMAA